MNPLIKNTFRIAACLVFLCAYSSVWAENHPLKIVAWNVEHLNEHNETGCVPRTDADYEEIVQNIEKMDPDVVAFQEVENAAAAARIFDLQEWQIEFSTRPNTGPGNECRGLPGQQLRHLGTGFAVKKGLEFTRNEDFDDLGLDDDFQRWGTDITLIRDGKPALRMLSIHLRSGCWGPPQDEQPARACPNLREQSTLLTTWVAARTEEDVPFGVLGDFNRRLAMPDDWMWAELNAELGAPLHLLDQGVGAKCDPRYKDFIDHIVLDPRAFQSYVADSFEEIPRTSEHPDHCAITALMNL